MERYLHILLSISGLVIFRIFHQISHSWKVRSRSVSHILSWNPIRIILILKFSRFTCNIDLYHLCHLTWLNQWITDIAIDIKLINLYIIFVPNILPDYHSKYTSSICTAPKNKNVQIPNDQFNIVNTDLWWNVCNKF